MRRTAFAIALVLAVPSFGEEVAQTAASPVQGPAAGTG